MSILAIKNFMALEKGRDYEDTMIFVFLSGQNLSWVQWKEKYKFIMKWTRSCCILSRPRNEKKKPGHVEVDVAAWKPYRSFAALFFCLPARATATCNSQLLTTPKKSSAEILTNKIVILT